MGFRFRPKKTGQDKTCVRLRHDPSGIEDSPLSARLGSILPAMGLVILSTVSLVRAQESGWSVEVGADRAAVSVEGRDSFWGTDYFRLSHLSAAQGASLTVELQRRDGNVDAVLLAGGHRHFGRSWTLSAQAGLAPRADFYFRHMAEVELARHWGRVVTHLSYRNLGFKTGTVHVVSPAATVRFSRAEIQARAFLARSADFAPKSAAFLFRGDWDASGRIRLSGGAAVGEGIFDVTSLAGASPPGWVAFLASQFRLSPRNLLGIVVTLAHEDPAFERRSAGFYYRRLL